MHFNLNLLGFHFFLCLVSFAASDAAEGKDHNNSNSSMIGMRIMKKMMKGLPEMIPQTSEKERKKKKI